MNVVVGVGGGIAAYKIAYVVRGLRRRGHCVTVIPTESSLNFVGLQTWQELSERPVPQRVFHGTGEQSHIEIARNADLIIVAPTTANLLAKFRSGLADDLLTTVFLAANCPKLLIPAMHTQMWANPATQSNVENLRGWGVRVLDPAVGALSSGDTGPGRMPEPEQILAEVDALLAPPAKPLAGKKVVVTAGGTREPIDPVRYLGNNSSGRQGIELARAAAEMGAHVILAYAGVDVPLPDHPNITNLGAPTASLMFDALKAHVPASDALFMAAAIADYRPVQVSESKLKKSEMGDRSSILLHQNPDLLRTVAKSDWRPPVLVGFAAETGSREQVAELGKIKARQKDADLLAINEVGNGKGFGEVDNQLLVVDAKGIPVAEMFGSKAEVAQQLVSLAFSVSG